MQCRHQILRQVNLGFAAARIEQVLRPNGMDWVTCLRAPQIAQLSAERGPFLPSLFDERNLIEVTSEQYPGERLVVCRNPLLADERTRKREALLQATEATLDGLFVIRTSVNATRQRRNRSRLQEPR